MQAGGRGEASAAPPAVAALRRQLDGHLAALEFPSDPLTAPLVGAIRDCVLAEGARLRPVLTMATAEALGWPPSSVLPLAAAVEMIHIHTGIHDDLPSFGTRLADATPAADPLSGEGVALLTGDALLAEAFALVVKDQAGEPARLVAAVAELARAVGAAGLVAAPAQDPTGAPVDGRLRSNGRHRRRADRLVRACVEAVVALVGGPDRSVAALRRFAAAIGLLAEYVELPPGRRDGAPCPECLAREVHASAHDALADVAGPTATLAQVTDWVLVGHP